MDISSDLEWYIDHVLIKLNWTDDNLIVDGFEIKEDVIVVSVANLTSFQTVQIDIKTKETVH